MQGDMFSLSDSRSVRMPKLSGTWRHARLGLCAYTTSYKLDDDTAENAHYAHTSSSQGDLHCGHSWQTR